MAIGRTDQGPALCVSESVSWTALSVKVEEGRTGVGWNTISTHRCYSSEPQSPSLHEAILPCCTCEYVCACMSLCMCISHIYACVWTSVYTHTNCNSALATSRCYTVLSMFFSFFFYFNEWGSLPSSLHRGLRIITVIILFYGRVHLTIFSADSWL